MVRADVDEAQAGPRRCTVSRRGVAVAERVQYGGPRRGPQVTAWMRQVAMYVMHRRFGPGLNKAAKLFARDRSSVLHGVYQVEDACQDSYLTSAFVAFVEHQARTLLDDIQATETETGVLPSEYASVGGRRG